MYAKYFHDDGEPFSLVAKAMKELLDEQEEKRKKKEAVLEALELLKKKCLSLDGMKCEKCPLSCGGLDCFSVMLNAPKTFVDTLFAQEERKEEEKDV